jgi:hypothetical protein
LVDLGVLEKEFRISGDDGVQFCFIVVSKSLYCGICCILFVYRLWNFVIEGDCVCFLEGDGASYFRETL